MPDSENFLNQTFATEQFVTLTLLRRGGPRRARAPLLRPSATPLGRGYGSRLNPINSRGEARRGEKRRDKDRPNIGGISRLIAQEIFRNRSPCARILL